MLTSIITESIGDLRILPHNEIQTTKEVIEALENVLLSRGEGICVKHPDAQYFK